MGRFGLGMSAGLVLGLAAISVARGGDTSDAYLRGYVSAVVERDFAIPAEGLVVRDGVVTIQADRVGKVQREKLVEAVSRVKGVRRVEFAQTEPATRVSPAKEAAAVVGGVVVEPAEAARGNKDPLEFGILPDGHLFEPLMADQRWPDFSATYQAYQNDKKFQDMGAANFGGSFAAYRFKTPGGGASEVGVQAGLFSLFNMDTESHDLVNADYFVALTDSYRLGDFSVIGRVWHNSSHVGDEFLIAHPGFQRINLSWEQADAIFSYDLTKSIRVYGGGGYAFDLDPETLKPWSIEYGIEWKSPWTFAGGTLRPVAGLDLQHHEREKWDLDLSLRAGVQLERVDLRGSKVQFLFEYYNGRNPNGQFFFDSNVQWYGLGLHWFF